MSVLFQSSEFLKKYQFYALLVVLFIQLAVPLRMIFFSENALSSGRLYKFKCAPVDPFDPFRGKFVSLKFEAENYKSYDYKLETKREYYALLKENQSGFAEITNIVEAEPADGDYFKVKILKKSGDKILLEFPFNRYYIEESKAKAAEKVYRAQNEIAVAHVYISGGTTVLKKIMLADKILEEAVVEFLKKEND